MEAMGYVQKHGNIVYALEVFPKRLKNKAVFLNAFAFTWARLWTCRRHGRGPRNTYRDSKIGSVDMCLHFKITSKC